MTQEPSILSDLLGQDRVDGFLTGHYLKLPWAGTAPSHPWFGCAGRPDIERLLRHPQVDVLVGRDGQQWPGGSPRPEQISEIIEQGYTIGLRHVDRYDSNLNLLAKRFFDAFAAPVDIHLYYTPESQVGFGWHYDAEEVFILQTRGKKEWWLRKNTVNPWPLIDAIPSDQRYEREIMPVMHCQLDAGDWLYIPAGYWHKTRALSDSISLSIGIRAWTALDLYDSLRDQLAHSMLWRQRLPLVPPAAQSATDEIDRQWREICANLCDDLRRRIEEGPIGRDLIDRLLERRDDK